MSNHYGSVRSSSDERAPPPRPSFRPAGPQFGPPGVTVRPLRPASTPQGGLARAPPAQHLGSKPSQTQPQAGLYPARPAGSAPPPASIPTAPSQPAAAAVAAAGQFQQQQYQPQIYSPASFLPPAQAAPPQVQTAPPPPTMIPNPSSLPPPSRPSFMRPSLPQPAQIPSHHFHPPSAIPPPPSFGGPPATPPVATQPTSLPPATATAPHPAASIGSLTEEFMSLSVQATPGSMESSVDLNTLPRPLPSADIPQTVGPANAHPRYVRLTTTVMPNAQSLRSRWHLPLGAVVHPLAQPPPGEEVPVVNFGPSGIVRCRRCRTYINPYVTFVDGGRRWRCNVCGLLNEVPADYFCVLDSSGRRQDIDSRPELRYGSVEFEAPAEYMVRPPMPPAYFFLIDVSSASVRTGMLKVFADTVKACLDLLPGSPRTQVGFLAFDSALHFVNLKASLSQPQLLVVSDLDDVFLPLPDDLMVNLSDSRSVVDALLDSLPAMFQRSSSVESALGPALKAAYSIMSRLGGKLLVFQGSLPSIGVGRLRLRGEDQRIYGTDREHTLRVTEDAFYKTMAADFSRVQISVNMYVFSDKYSDLASLGTLSRYTTGQVYYYPDFHVESDGDKFGKELRRDLSRETGWEAVMRIRCGKGLKISTFHGHFFVRSVDLLALPAVDCDKAFAVQISHEETLLTTQTVYFQCALLYTSSSGERRIRVHTVAAPVVADLGEMYRSADAGAMATLLAKISIDKLLTGRLEDARQLVQQKLVQGLKEYKSMFQAQHRISGRLIYPASLRLLPLYVLGLTKSPALRGGFSDVGSDERSWSMYELMSMSVHRTLRLLYPLLLRLDNMQPEVGKRDGHGNFVFPRALPLVSAALDSKGAYLLDDGLLIWIWLGKEVAPQFAAQLAGSSEGQGQANAAGRRTLVANTSEVSQRVFAIVEQLKDGNGIHQKVFVTGAGDSSEAYFFQRLTEERGYGASSSSYADFVMNLYRQVQQK